MYYKLPKIIYCKGEKQGAILSKSAVCIKRNLSDPQKQRFIIESGFKSKTGYNGARRVYYTFTKGGFKSKDAGNF